jgi:glyoxylase-like metal-dependent hydrolase (beta-lactamase superfamily II)
MRFVRYSATAVAALLTLTVPGAAQQNFDAVEVRSQTVAPNIAVIFGAGGNIGVTWGPDGTVVIDDQYAPLTPRIEAAIAALGATPARFLINTHWHGDHTGGNENFGRRGTIIMAHDHVRERMASEQRRPGAAGQPDRVTPPSPAAALPILTWHDGIGLHLNGSEVRAIHAPHAHTDGDSIIHFRSANVIHMGDLFFHQVTLPFIDISSGGDARGVLAAAEAALALANDQTVIIPGHGPVARRADLVAYRDMLREVIGVVEREKAAGKTLAEIVAMRPAARWDTNPQAFIRGDAFVTAIWNSLERDHYGRHLRGEGNAGEHHAGAPHRHGDGEGQHRH